LPPSNLFSSPQVPRKTSRLPISTLSLSVSGGRRKKNKKNNLMSELIKACRSRIRCPVYVVEACRSLSCFSSSSFSSFINKKENVKKICRTSISLRHAHESLHVYKLPDWNLTEKVKR
jgi:hypothetical protein